MSDNLIAVSDESKMIHLKSKEGKSFTINLKAAKKSVVVQRLLEDLAFDMDEVEIPLPNVASSELERMIAFLEHHVNDPASNKAQWDAKLAKGQIEPFDTNLLDIDVEEITDLFAAANYMEIAQLANLCAWNIASQLKKCMTSDEIRNIFKEEDDFASEEMDELRKDFDWCQKSDN